MITICHEGQTDSELNFSFVKIKSSGRCVFYPLSLQNSDHLGYLYLGNFT